MTSDERFAAMEARAIRKEVFWIALGCSWGGNITKRDGKIVKCGHKHRTEKACKRCVKVMRRTRPGKCQTYRASEIHRLVLRRAPLKQEADDRS